MQKHYFPMLMWQICLVSAMAMTFPPAKRAQWIIPIFPNPNHSQCLHLASGLRSAVCPLVKGKRRWVCNSPKHPFPSLWINLALNIISHLPQSANVSIVRNWYRQVPGWVMPCFLKVRSSWSTLKPPSQAEPEAMELNSKWNVSVLTYGACFEPPTEQRWIFHHLASVELAFELLLRKIRVTTPP